MIKSIVKSSYHFSRAILEEYKAKHWYSRYPAKPTVVNMMANDICNSKCTMCNIWEQKKDYEISPAELETVLKDPLFSKVKSVGITGGEPTLREDLPDLYEAVCKTLPNVGSISVITNAIKEKDVIERIEGVKAVAKKYNKGFTVMVSLDGYGEVHDKNRGRDGNFESAINVINHFKNQGDYVETGCTVTKSNVWDVDELLDYMLENDIYGRFRVAEFINRLYNNELKDSIRNFTEDEQYHLACFFMRLSLSGLDKSFLVKRTYRSIISILTGGERKIGCPYQQKGVVLDSKGNLAYCAPKSEIVGNVIKESAWDIYKGNLAERNRVKEEACGDCVHDYHHPLTVKEGVELAEEFMWKYSHRFGFLKPFANLFFSPKQLTKKLFKQKFGDNKVVFITGWYGTETVGDKAILGAIIDDYIAQFDGKVKFIISAIIPFITYRTLKELDIEAEVIPAYHKDFFQAAKLADISVMGGGPLMGINELSLPQLAFRTAKKHNKQRVVFGCGIGPLDEEKHVNMVKDILTDATEIKLRDYKSIEWGKELSGRDDITYYGDPAYRYVKKLKDVIQVGEKKPVLACFLRDWSTEYKGSMTIEEYELTKVNFEKNIAEQIKQLCDEFGLVPHFYCMHTFIIGGDDRVFYRKFVKEHFQGREYHIENQPATVDLTVRAMKSASINLCMRFHSVLFAHTLDTNFIAIDYTNGGKITGFMTDNKQLDRMLPLKDIADKKAKTLIEVLSAV